MIGCQAQCDHNEKEIKKELIIKIIQPFEENFISLRRNKKHECHV